MLIHTVCFWLRENLKTEERAEFQNGLESLKGIASAAAVHVGTPAATEARPVIDDSYDYCLTVVLEDLAAHDAYQVDPLHRDFLARFAAYWERVCIYDAD
ncbi:MAG: Dabb family protein [Verrucomicrobia bacterium]|nr:Dabb family protein [Verrucomicrobiota bacterium]